MLIDQTIYIYLIFCWVKLSYWVKLLNQAFCYERIKTDKTD